MHPCEVMERFGKGTWIQKPVFALLSKLVRESMLLTYAGPSQSARDAKLQNSSSRFLALGIHTSQLVQSFLRQTTPGKTCPQNRSAQTIPCNRLQPLCLSFFAAPSFVITSLPASCAQKTGGGVGVLSTPPRPGIAAPRLSFSKHRSGICQSYCQCGT